MLAGGAKVARSVPCTPVLASRTRIATHARVAVPVRSVGGGVLEDRTVLPWMVDAATFSISFDTFYRVILHYTAWSDDNITAKQVAKAVPALTYSEALRIVQAASRYGSAIVVTVPLDDARLYELRLTRFGFKASIEEA